MSPQMSLTYDASYVGRDVWERQLDIIRLAVAHLGLKEVSFKLDVSGSMLSDAMNQRDRKRWAAEWTHVLVAMLLQRSDEISLGFVRQIYLVALESTPFVLEIRHTLTAEEILERLRRDERGREAIARVLEVRR